MNSLLIYNNNVSFILPRNFENLQLGESYPFQIGKQELMEKKFSIDKKIHDILSTEINRKTYDVIFLPYSLSEENYLEFIGLRFAYHIRLTQEFNNIQTPIVFYGFEDAITLNKLSELGLILFTKKVYQTEKITAEDFKSQIAFIQKQEVSIAPNSDNYFLKTFVSKVRITPPSNYESHHSIDNELALLQWSEYLKCDKDIPEVKQNIQTSLYYKYIKALRPVKKNAANSFVKIDGKAKILLIDDEANKGWFLFYKSLFKHNNAINLDTLNIEYSSYLRDEIITKAMEKIKGFNPDLILLDLRLCDEDFMNNTKTSPQDLTGYRILKGIKDFNKGMQVIITTASNKAWNYQATVSEGANYYVIKSGNSDIAENMELFVKHVEEAIRKASLLKKVATEFREINALIQSAHSFSTQYKKSVTNNLEIAFKLLEEHYKIPKYINYSYLQLFLIIEEFLKEESIFIEGDKCYVVNKEKIYLVLKLRDGLSREQGFDSAIQFYSGHYVVKNGFYSKKYIDTNFKMSAVLLFLYGFESSGEKNWTAIINTRNSKAAHPEISIVEINEYNKLVSFMNYILNPSNVVPIAEENGLVQPALEEQIIQLQKKYKK